MDVSRHAGAIAVVTGGAAGIGQATVLRLAREGARVLTCDLDEDGLARTAALAREDGLEVATLIADVSSQADTVRIIAAAGPRIDVLVNNAGIMDHFLPLAELDDATWEHVLGVNLTGVMRLTRAVLPTMVGAGSGSIVTVASEASLGAGAAGVAYTTSKHAVLGLVKHVAYFYGPKGIRSNAVLPGGVATGPSMASTSAAASQWAMERAMAKLATMPPRAQPDQIAAAVSWLACSEASNVNGAILADDGGWAAA